MAIDVTTLPPRSIGTRSGSRWSRAVARAHEISWVATPYRGHAGLDAIVPRAARVVHAHGAVAGIADPLQLAEPRGRGPVSRAQHVAIGFREVDVGQQVADAGQRSEHVLFLDVHVEGIDHHAEAGQAQAADQLGHFGDGVVEADFAVVHRLKGQGHALLGGVLAHVADRLTDAGADGGAVGLVAEPPLERAVP